MRVLVHGILGAATYASKDDTTGWYHVCPAERGRFPSGVLFVNHVHALHTLPYY